MNLSQKLLSWFDKHQRPLPWRVNYDPYQVWVSEIMLQQTQVETALPYFNRWMKEFPDIRTLALSDEKQVLKMWQGLGYYSRARNLHRGAKTIHEQFSSRLPSDYNEILKLKGIGRYTAGAIASIAFNQEKPIVDGNVLRVLSRVYAIDKPIDVEKNKEQFWSLQEKLIPKGKARFFNQALMELGALICSKNNPSCLICPIRDDCKAFKTQTVENYPVKQFKKKMVKVTASALLLKHKNSFFIHRRPEGKIMGGLWEFPEWKLAQNKTLSKANIKNLTLQEVQKEFSYNPIDINYLGLVKRNYTHHLESLHVFEASTKKRVVDQRGWPNAWSSKTEIAKYPFSSAHIKIYKMLEQS